MWSKGSSTQGKIPGYAPATEDLRHIIGFVPGGDELRELMRLWPHGVSVLTVDNDGAIDVPLVGLVKVAGMSARQVEQELVRLLGVRVDAQGHEQGYLKSPNIAINVKEFRSQLAQIIRKPIPPAMLDALRTRFGDRVSMSEAVRAHHGRDESAYDPMLRRLKVVVIGAPEDAAALLKSAVFLLESWR